MPGAARPPSWPPCRTASKARSIVDADTQGTDSRWLEQGEMLLRGEALPLESPRAAERWIARVLGLDADMIVIDCPPHIGAGRSGILYRRGPDHRG